MIALSRVIPRVASAVQDRGSPQNPAHLFRIQWRSNAPKYRPHRHPFFRPFRAWPPPLPSELLIPSLVPWEQPTEACAHPFPSLHTHLSCCPHPFPCCRPPPPTAAIRSRCLPSSEVSLPSYPPYLELADEAPKGKCLPFSRRRGKAPPHLFPRWGRQVNQPYAGRLSPLAVPPLPADPMKQSESFRNSNDAVENCMVLVVEVEGGRWGHCMPCLGCRRGRHWRRMLCRGRGPRREARRAGRRKRAVGTDPSLP
jgi:hypothetical protein